MKQSRRAVRMEHRAERRTRVSPMNLVSLMDIFTILVFFLLVQSSAVEVLPNTDALELPESLAEEFPRETTLVMVTTEDVLVQGKRVMSTAAALRSESAELLPLRKALEQQARRVIQTGDALEEGRGELTIMADKTLPYELLKKIMVTCTKAEFGLLSFAVMQRDGATVNLSGDDDS